MELLPAIMDRWVRGLHSLRCYQLASVCHLIAAMFLWLFSACLLDALSPPLQLIASALAALSCSKPRNPYASLLSAPRPPPPNTHILPHPAVLSCCCAAPAAHRFVWFLSPEGANGARDPAALELLFQSLGGVTKALGTHLVTALPRLLQVTAGETRLRLMVAGGPCCRIMGLCQGVHTCCRTAFQCHTLQFVLFWPPYVWAAIPSVDQQQQL